MLGYLSQHGYGRNIKYTSAIQIISKYGTAHFCTNVCNETLREMVPTHVVGADPCRIHSFNYLRVIKPLKVYALIQRQAAAPSAPSSLLVMFPCTHLYKSVHQKLAPCVGSLLTSFYNQLARIRKPKHCSTRNAHWHIKAYNY
jgi:hypothetical protein